MIFFLESWRKISMTSPNEVPFEAHLKIFFQNTYWGQPHNGNSPFPKGKMHLFFKAMDASKEGHLLEVLICSTVDSGIEASGK